MNGRLSEDGSVLALLKSRLALPRGEERTALSDSEGTQVEAALANAGEPLTALHGMPAEPMSSRYGIPPALAARVHRLLARAGQFSVERQRLADRGMWLLSRRDEGYPQRWLERLGTRAPLVIYGAGEMELLRRPAVAVVGSRNPAEEALAFATAVAQKTVADGLMVVSGGAKGIDRQAMSSAVEAGGCSVGILADSLERTIRDPETRQAVMDGRACLVTPYEVSAHFDVGNAMGRNKLVYCLSVAAFVASATEGSGGTWEGALENLKHDWAPIYVRDSGEAAMQQLIARGAGHVRIDELRGLSFAEMEIAWRNGRAAARGLLFE